MMDPDRDVAGLASNNPGVQKRLAVLGRCHRNYCKLVTPADVLKNMKPSPFEKLIIILVIF